MSLQQKSQRAKELFAYQEQQNIQKVFMKTESKLAKINSIKEHQSNFYKK